MDYSAWRKAWDKRPWKLLPPDKATSFEVCILFADGTEYGGTSPGPDSHTALARVYALARMDKVARGNPASEVVDYCTSAIHGSCDKPLVFVRRRMDPDRARIAVNRIVQAEMESDRMRRKSAAFTNGVRARFDAQSNPLRWTDKELALAESRANALADMLAAEESAVRRIRAGIEREKARKSAER